MNVRHVLKSAIMIRRARTRWVYLAPAAAVLLVLPHGIEDDGWKFALPMLFLLGLCLAQAVYPTVLGWALLVIPFAYFSFGIVVRMWKERSLEVLPFLILGGIPMILLLVFRPGRQA